MKLYLHSSHTEHSCTSSSRKLHSTITGCLYPIRHIMTGFNECRTTGSCSASPRSWIQNSPVHANESLRSHFATGKQNQPCDQVTLIMHMFDPSLTQSGEWGPVISDCQDASHFYNTKAFEELHTTATTLEIWHSHAPNCPDSFTAHSSWPLFCSSLIFLLTCDSCMHPASSPSKFQH